MTQKRGRPSKFTAAQQKRIAKVWRDKSRKQPERIALLKSKGMTLSVGTANRIALKIEAVKLKTKARKGKTK